MDSCLDALESKNDDLFSRIQSLLEDSRQARQQLVANESENIGKLTIADCNTGEATDTDHMLHIEERQEIKTVLDVTDMSHKEEQQETTVLDTNNMSHKDKEQETETDLFQNQ